MAVKEAKFIEYNRKGKIVDIVVRDENGGKEGTFKATNQRDYARVISLIEKKWGYKPIIDIDHEVIKEQDWLKKDLEW